MGKSGRSGKGDRASGRICRRNASESSSYSRLFARTAGLEPIGDSGLCGGEDTCRRSLSPTLFSHAPLPYYPQSMHCGHIAHPSGCREDIAQKDTQNGERLCFCPVLPGVSYRHRFSGVWRVWMRRGPRIVGAIEGRNGREAEPEGRRGSAGRRRLEWGLGSGGWIRAGSGIRPVRCSSPVGLDRVRRQTEDRCRRILFLIIRAIV